MDGGGEYVSNDFWKFYDQGGIVHEVEPPYTQQKLPLVSFRN